MRDDTREGLNQSANEIGLLCLEQEVKQALIPGGYYMMARKIEESWIATAAPCTREVWHWLIRNANHKEGKSKGDMVQRGQKIITTESLQDSLAWRIGYRKKKYSRRQCEGALKVLTKERMVVLAKVHHATLVTIVHYDFYQNPKNYEGASEATPEGAYEGTTKSQEALTNKNGENERMEELSPPLIPPKGKRVKKYPPFDPVDPNRNTLSNHNSNRIIKPAKKNSVIVLNPDEEEFVQKLYDYLKKNHAGITITLEGQREAFAKLKSKGFHLEDIRRAMKHATSDTIDKRRENGERGTYCHANNVKSLNKLLDKHGRQDQLWIGVLLDEVKQKQMRISEYE